jgi:RNA polymerase sigma factor (sigma-70 family)
MSSSVHIDSELLRSDIAAFQAGADDAGSRLALVLRVPLRIEAEKYLSLDHGDIDDVVQDATISTLAYLKNRSDFEGDLVKLAVTITRNRCRDLHRWRSTKPEIEITSMSDWLEDGSASALDEILAEERVSLIQVTLNSISASCRRLLHALYVLGLPTETVRQKTGLSTVQGVYYRRTICLTEAKKFLQEQLRDRSHNGRVGGACGSPRPER